MLKGDNNGFYDFAEHRYYGLILNHSQCNNDVKEAIYGSDEFRMYVYKIRRCTRIRSHDWTDCPYAHRGEKAQRRDPRRIPYCATACPAFRNGRCYKGDSCGLAHGVFEYWLHPARYRTRACNAGRFCQRKVCFFAHTPEQLRPEGKTRCHFACSGRMNCGDPQQQHLMMGSSSTTGGDQFATSEIVMPKLSPLPPMPSAVKISESCFDEVSEVLKSMRAMETRDDKNVEVSDADLPNIEWISDLVR